ncbi:MAG: TIGR01459 family HAD-type hydrolase [Hyphomicrobiaceae bacterium]
MTIPIIAHAGPLLGRYRVVLCDVWGVVHDGITAYPGANEALPRFRQAGGVVVLVSNAPRPGFSVAHLLDEKSVVRQAWDAIVTSGDIALAHIAQAGYRRLYRIGPERRDRAFFDGLPGPHTPIDEADAIVCTGLNRERHEQPEVYVPLLEQALARRLPFICANPDLAVHVGEDLLPCAGAIASLYEERGGTVFWAGKPHPIAYRTALARAADLTGGPVARSDVLAIGDSVRTDLAAAAGAGVDALLIAGGLHRDEVMSDGEIDPARLASLLAPSAPGPVAVMRHLAW